MEENVLKLKQLKPLEKLRPRLRTYEYDAAAKVHVQVRRPCIQICKDSLICDSDLLLRSKPSVNGLLICNIQARNLVPISYMFLT